MGPAFSQEFPYCVRCELRQFPLPQAGDDVVFQYISVVVRRNAGASYCSCQYPAHSRTGPIPLPLSWSCRKPVPGGRASLNTFQWRLIKAVQRIRLSSLGLQENFGTVRVLGVFLHQQLRRPR